uniref:Uncharacterized protein n=1 Tax=viral metagenome TaxID=1070528 RepID=A0A6M3L9H9_9ZZZZ
MREKILLSGEMNTSKTLSLVSLAVLYPDSKVVILDPDDGTEKMLDELGIGDLPNLTVIPVTPDFEVLIENYRLAKGILGKGDWLCFDMMGRFWDFAQQYYSQTVFGVSHIEHLMMLKKQAQSTSFSGFDGLQDWPLIKNLHSADLIDDAVLWSPFNVMATTSVTNFSPKEKVPTVGTLGIYASEFGIKPEGEKHNIYRFDSQAVLYRKREGTYHFRMVRDRGRNVELKREFNITGKSFMEVYAEYRGL